MKITGDATEILGLADAFDQSSARAVPAMRNLFREVGDGVAREWRSNADEHFSKSGHAKHYSRSITADLLPGIDNVTVDIGPDRASKQGFLGPVLEHGGRFSPAYRDGLRAVDGYQARAERMIDSTIGYLLP